MMPFSLRSLRAFLKIAPDATSFVARGFQIGVPSTQELLEHSASTFVLGYHTALDSNDNATLASRLEEIDQPFRGFAYEGAGMALALLDFFSPWKKRFLPFSLAEGNDHIYMLYVGWGWSMGRLPRKQIRITSQAPYDPLLRWLAYDGYGFHEGFFSSEKRIVQQRRPLTLPQGYAQRAFDQGLGRSMWFVYCGDVSAIASRISTFPQTRQSDLWSGIGLACTYAGGVPVEDLQKIQDLSAPFHEHLAQGTAFAVKARTRAGNLVEHTKRASEIICGMSADEVVRIVELATEALPPDGLDPSFEVWRQRIQTALRVPVTAT
jgi:enediyne biosynthesis protein E3